jgi:large subunit ribosomal protein L2
MAIKRYKKNTAGRRKMSVIDYNEALTKGVKPVKKLLIIKKRTGGRNATGKITVRHRGGGAKRMIRIIDFKRLRLNDPATVKAIEYDPNRSAFIARIEYGDGMLSYILAGEGLKVGHVIVHSKERKDVKVGNRYSLEVIPVGQEVYNVELAPGKGGQIARSAGQSLRLMGIEGKFAQIKMPSGEIRQVKKECSATIGRVSNADNKHITIGKAGRKRHMGIKPTVRGKVMNPVDHPHGGGEAANSIGLKRPKTKWGKPALGVKTRRKHASDKLILTRRKK